MVLLLEKDIIIIINFNFKVHERINSNETLRLPEPMNRDECFKDQTETLENKVH